MPLGSVSASRPAISHGAVQHVRCVHPQAAPHPSRKVLVVDEKELKNMRATEQLAVIQEAVKELTDAKAKGVTLDPEEQKLLERGDYAISKLEATIERQKAAGALWDRIAGKGREEDMDGNPIAAGGSKSQEWAAKALGNLKAIAPSIGTHGAKALVTGTINVPAILGQTVTIDTPPRSLLDLIPVAPPRGGGDDEDKPNTFGTLRQSTRTNNAAAVADLAAKPTSLYTFGQVDDTYRVYANKTEDLPWRFLSDFAGLINIIRVQLVEDTLNAMEKDVISGAAGGAGFTGLLNTSGVVTQAWSTDMLTTISNAKYGFLGANRPVTGWVMNPLDLQKLEQLRENGSTGAFLFRSRAEIEDRVGARIVTSTGLAVGTALAGDWSESELLPVGDDELVVDAGKRTTNNTFLLMYEGRYGFRVKKPGAFTKITLAGA